MLTAQPWPRGKKPVRVELPQWLPSHRQDQLNAIRSEFEIEGFSVSEVVEFGDWGRRSPP
jgi:hypothetical protein